MAEPVVTTLAEVESIIARIRKAPYIALDIETAYATKADMTKGLKASGGSVRLVQLAWLEDGTIQDCVIDLWAVGRAVDWMPRLLDPYQLTIIHFSTFEFEWLYWHFGIDLQNIYDTCRAWQKINKARKESGWRGETHKASLGEVAKFVLGINMDKALQISHWGARVLSEEQIHYARLDARILIPLYLATQRHAKKHRVTNVIKADFKGRAWIDAIRVRCDHQPGSIARFVEHIEHAAFKGELDRWAIALEKEPLSFHRRLDLDRAIAARGKLLEPQAPHHEPPAPDQA